LQDGKIIGYGDIQTRHYRAPEIILRLEQTEKCDIWAIGCVAYELLTGKVLFEPNKTTNITTDLKQLYDIQCLLGIFSENMFTGRKNDIFFKNNFFIKKFDKLNHVDFKTLLQKNISNNTLTTTTLDIISDFLLNCLTLDQSHRPSASVLLTHTYLTS
jgi:serine/threonine-protein kinase SRPK3